MIHVINKRHQPPTNGSVVYVGRPSLLGNPYRPANHGVGETFDAYYQWLREQ